MFVFNFVTKNFTNPILFESLLLDGFFASRKWKKHFYIEIFSLFEQESNAGWYGSSIASLQL